LLFSFSKIAETNGLWTVKIDGNPRDMLITFAMEQEFEHTTSEGRDVKAIYTIEGNKMICHQVNLTFFVQKFKF